MCTDGRAHLNPRLAFLLLLLLNFDSLFPIWSVFFWGGLDFWFDRRRLDELSLRTNEVDRLLRQKS